MDYALNMVREFHEAYGQPVNLFPEVQDRDLNALRVSLIREELLELEEALAAGDPVATLDALTDLQYVLDGAYLSLGFASFKQAAFEEVHTSNMSKLGEDGKPILRNDGKVLKGPRYRSPDLKTVLCRVPTL